jgi:hypothetical protein
MHAPLAIAMSLSKAGKTKRGPLEPFVIQAMLVSTMMKEIVGLLMF